VLTEDEKAEERDESGWKLVHADVFRPPSSYPMMFCVLVGTGVQLFLMAVITIIFAAVGFLSPANRGSLMISVRARSKPRGAPVKCSTLRVRRSHVRSRAPLAPLAGLVAPTPPPLIGAHCPPPTSPPFVRPLHAAPHPLLHSSLSRGRARAHMRLLVSSRARDMSGVAARDVADASSWSVVVGS